MILSLLGSFAQAAPCEPPAYELTAELAGSFRYLGREPSDPWAGVLVSLDARYRSIVADMTWGSDWTDTFSARLGLVGRTGVVRVAAGFGYAFDNWAHPGHSGFGWLRVGFEWRTTRDPKGSGLLDLGVAFHQAPNGALAETATQVTQGTMGFYGLGFRSALASQSSVDAFARFGALYTLEGPVLCDAPTTGPSPESAPPPTNPPPPPSSDPKHTLVAVDAPSDP